MFIKNVLFSINKYTTVSLLIIPALVINLFVSFIGPARVKAEDTTTRPIIFPVIGGYRFSNDYFASRPGAPDGIHKATDIMADKGQPLVAATNGTVDYVISPEANWGYSIGITDSEGYQYNYLHINNDTPGTNDNKGGEMNAYAPDMKVGNHVEAGQLLGWVGESGYSSGIPHLHFEMYKPDGTVINPYYSLISARHVPSPSLYPPLAGETLPYWVSFGGGLNLAMGDFNGDQQSETVTGAGIGGGPHVKTYNGNNQFLGEFFAYDPAFRGGIDVAAGDVNGDGTDEIITGPGPGGGPWVRVFNTSSQKISEFAAYDTGFKGGIRVTTGDVNGDGTDEIITGPGPGGGPWVRVFNLSGQVLNEFAAYDTGFKGGIDVAAADTAGTSNAEIVTSPGPGGGPHIRAYSTNGQIVSEFFAYDSAFKGGVKVSAGNVRTSTAKAEIMTVPSDYGGPHVRLLSGSGSNINQSVYLESWWRGYYDVAAGNNTSRVGTGLNRRASMRNGPN